MSRPISKWILFWHNKQMYLLGKKVSKHNNDVIFIEKIIQKSYVYTVWVYKFKINFYLGKNIGELGSEDAKNA